MLRDLLDNIVKEGKALITKEVVKAVPEIVNDILPHPNGYKVLDRAPYKKVIITKVQEGIYESPTNRRPKYDFR